MDKPKLVHVAVIEEEQGVSEAVWKAVERMCADPGSKGKVFSVFAPADAAGNPLGGETNRMAIPNSPAVPKGRLGDPLT